mmetsp:Transcript_22903/g.22193  ORF Transcript_22903/g.22193 Transcript_22903/m.22193 type:complete len:102 (-) Transcript_22903:322-627(-)
MRRYSITMKLKRSNLTHFHHDLEDSSFSSPEQELPFERKTSLEGDSSPFEKRSRSSTEKRLAEFEEEPEEPKNKSYMAQLLLALGLGAWYYQNEATAHCES